MKARHSLRCTRAGERRAEGVEARGKSLLVATSHVRVAVYGTQLCEEGPSFGPTQRQGVDGADRKLRASRVRGRLPSRSR